MSCYEVSSASLEAITEEEICIESDTAKLDTTKEGVCVDEIDEELKEVNDDMELLELNNDAVSEPISLEGQPDVQAPLVFSPELSGTNRRYSLRPKRRPETTNCDKYLSIKSRKNCISVPKNTCLETIFENPIIKKGALTLLGKSKRKRYLSLDSFVNKAKLKQRKLKLKRFSKAKGVKINKTCKVTIEDVKRKLKELEDEDEWMEIQE